MKKIKKILREINSSLGRLEMFFIIVKTLVILTLSYLFFFMIDVVTYLAFVPAFVYFISSMFVQYRIDNVKKVERKYKALDEKILTARDYKDKDNVILDELESEIVNDLKDVRISKFFPYSKMMILLLLLIFSVSASLYISSQNIKVIDFNDLMEQARKMIEQENQPEVEEADFISTQESIMQVGDEKIEVEINPVGLDFDFNEVSEAANYEFSTAFPKDVFISSGAAYENEFSEDQQVLIKRYFENKNK